MPNSYTSSNIIATVPAIGDAANVTVAFEQYHTSIADDINSKQATITGAATSVLVSNLTANSVVVSNSTGKLVNSGITTAQLGTLSGLSSQAQILNPTGVIAPYMGFTVPDGWLFCNGATVVKSSYPNLANVIAPTIHIGEITYSSDGESGDDIIDFSVGLDYDLAISLISSQQYTVSLTANAAVRTATRLAEIADFPASNTLFELETVSASVLRWRGGLESGINDTWMNSDGNDGLAYSEPELNFTLNIYGTPSTVTNMVLPNFNNRFMYGSSSMANVSALQGSSTHTHVITGMYAQIARDGTAIVLKETGAVSSWTPTERVVGSSGAANTTARTDATAIGGSLASATHLPPYITVKYIIKT